MKDIITSLILMLCGLTIFLMAKSYGVDSASLSGNSGLLPQSVSIILGILGLTLLIKVLVNKAKEKIAFNKMVFLKILVFMFIIIFYLPLIELFGYLPATIIFLFSIMVFIGSSVKKSGIYAFVISGSLYVVFSIIFKIPLP